MLGRDCADSSPFPPACRMKIWLDCSQRLLAVCELFVSAANAQPRVLMPPEPRFYHATLSRSLPPTALVKRGRRDLKATGRALQEAMLPFLVARTSVTLGKRSIGGGADDSGNQAPQSLIIISGSPERDALLKKIRARSSFSRPVLICNCILVY